MSIAYFKFNNMKRNTIMSDNMLSIAVSSDDDAQSKNKEYIGIYQGGNNTGEWLYISIKKTKLLTDNASGIAGYLQQSPTTVYYELKEPVITDIISPSVRIYKDGYLTFNTLVAPESTHLVQLNKSAQINNTLEQVQSLNKKVDALDIIYNSLISSTSNTLSNLNK